MLEKSDRYHLKLLDGATGDLLCAIRARFCELEQAGCFEIRRFERQGWDRTAVLSELGVLEWMRQLVTMRFRGHLMVGGEGVGWSRDWFFFFQWILENELLTSPHDTRIANYKICKSR